MSAAFLVLSSRGEDPASVIPGEDPGSIVKWSPLQTPAARSGSRIKSGTTVKKVRDDWQNKSGITKVADLARHFQASLGRIHRACRQRQAPRPKARP